MRSLAFTARGLPGPKGSRNVGVRKDGTTYTREQSKRATQWQKDVMLQARSAMAKAGYTTALDPPYSVRLIFVLKEPETPTWAWPVSGDLDKLERATLDGLQKAGVILEDKHVIASDTVKRWGNENYAYIRIDTISPL